LGRGRPGWRGRRRGSGDGCRQLPASGLRSTTGLCSAAAGIRPATAAGLLPGTAAAAAAGLLLPAGSNTLGACESSLRA